MTTDNIDPRSEYEPDTLGYQMWALEQEAKRLGATHILAGIDQLNARLANERDTVLRSHFSA